MSHAIIIEINVCRNACVFCSPDGLPKKVDPGRMADIGRYALQQAVELSRKGVVELEISGADPIEYPRIEALVRILRNKLGFQKIVLSTHGRNFCDQDFARRMVDAGLNNIRIPLYGPTAAVHDAATRSPGSFSETVKGLENIRRLAPDIRLILTSLFMRSNVRFAAMTFRLLARYADEIRFGLPCVAHEQFEQNHAVDLADLRPAVREVLTLAEEFKGKARVMDVPCCVIGTDHPLMINHTPPPETADAYSIPEVFRSGVPFTPSYRLKQRLPVCVQCGVANKCDGFYKSYIRRLEAETMTAVKARV